MEAAQLRRYHAIYPHNMALLSQMSDEQCAKMLSRAAERKTDERGSSVRTQAFELMMQPHLPPTFSQHGGRLISKGSPIRSLDKKAAAGLVAAVKSGYLSDNILWMQIYTVYADIVATAEEYNADR